MKLKESFALIASIGFLLSSSAFAGHKPSKPVPHPPVSSQHCIDTNGKELNDDPGKVINWKLSTANQFKARARVSGTISKIFSDQNGHNHFEIKIGPNDNDTLEVIYNISFGSLGSIKTGMNVDTCGDYITSNAPTGTYPASPDGAIIHWIHATNNPQKHLGGFLIIDNVVYGYGSGNGN